MLDDVPADATINLEAQSSGKIPKGCKVVNNHLISQVANVPISSPFEVKCDSNGDMYIDVEDANWSAYYLYITGVEL